MPHTVNISKNNVHICLVYLKQNENFESELFVRQILSRYLDRPPEGIAFVRNDFGKPSLSPDINPDHLEFNLSHTDSLSMLAIMRGSPIGVDIEKVQSWRKGLDQIVEAYFAQEEIAIYKALPQQDKSTYFYTLWTLKEAFMKARGEGLQTGLDQVSVTLLEDAKPRIAFQGKHLEGWTFHSFVPKPGYIAALATPQTIQSIEVFEIEEEF